MLDIRLKDVIRREEGVSGLQISEDIHKYKDVMFYREGYFDDVVREMMNIIVSQAADIREVYEMYSRSKIKYPDSWWVVNLSPLMERLEYRGDYTGLSQFIRSVLMKLINKLESDKGKILRRCANPETIFEELRSGAYNFDMEEFR